MQIMITSPSGTFDITQLVQNVQWSGDYQQAARTLRLNIISSASDSSIPVVDCPLGSSIQMLEEQSLLFDGFLLGRDKNSETSSLSLTCYDRGFYLKQNKACYKFVDTPAEQIAAQVAEDFGFALGKVAATGVPITRNFINVSLYDILQTAYTLASRTTGDQYHIGFAADKLQVLAKTQQAHTLIIRGESNLIRADVGESVEHMVNTVSIYDQNENFVQTMENAEAVALYGRMQECLVQSEQDNQMEQAQKTLNDRGKPIQKISVDCLGSIHNITGGTVVVEEPYTGLHGLFYIDGDTHEWKNGQYYNKLVLNFEKIMNETAAGSEPDKKGG